MEILTNLSQTALIIHHLEQDPYHDRQRFHFDHACKNTNAITTATANIPSKRVICLSKSMEYIPWNTFHSSMEVPPPDVQMTIQRLADVRC